MPKPERPRYEDSVVTLRYWYEYCSLTVRYWYECIRRVPRPLLLAIIAGVLAICWLPRLIMSVESRESRARIASQIELIKGGRRDSLVGADPRFLGDVLKDAACAPNVKKLYFFNDRISDWRFGRLKKLPNVAQIFAHDTRGTDSFMKRISGMKSVESLTFLGTDLSKSGTKHLSTFPNLKSLTFGPAEVDEAGLLHLEGLAHLERLNLALTQTSDAELAHLKGLTGLQTLSLEDTPVTDAGLKHLRALTKLEVLSLKGTSITAAAVEYLQELTGLKTLNLEDTQITDAVLEILSGSDEPGKANDIEPPIQLEELYLYNTRVTNAGVRKLRKALPNCEIVRGLILTSDQFFNRLKPTERQEDLN